jgi:hypothetical protein
MARKKKRKKKTQDAAADPAASKAKSTPIIERTDSRGLVKLKLPWVGGAIDLEFPGTNRSVMVIAVVGLIAFTIILPCTVHLIVNADPETTGTLIRSLTGAELSDTKPNEPVKVPVKNNQGDIELIEVCPPCAVCEEPEECPECPVCVCPSCPQSREQPTPKQHLGEGLDFPFEAFPDNNPPEKGDLPLL